MSPREFPVLSSTISESFRSFIFSLFFAFPFFCIFAIEYQKLYSSLDERSKNYYNAVMPIDSQPAWITLMHAGLILKTRNWDQLQICVKEKREIKKYGVPFPKEIVNHSPVSLSCPWGPSPTSSVAVESAATGKERTEWDDACSF